jgi:hypothetical protein
MAEVKEKEKEKEDFDPKDIQRIDITDYFHYQRAINSLIDYLNQSIDDIIAGFTRSDQMLFSHINKKLILNAILESGFYEFCKFRLAQLAENKAKSDKEMFVLMMESVQGEIDLLAYLLVNTRLAHRPLNFDLYLSLLKGGLFADIMTLHEKIVKDMHKRKQDVNKNNIKSNIKIENTDNLYI